MILLFPGYALTLAFYPEAGEIELSERIGLAVICSALIAGLAAGIENLLPSGLNLYSALIGEKRISMAVFHSGLVATLATQSRKTILNKPLCGHAWLAKRPQ